MHGNVVEVRAEGIADYGTVSSRFRYLAEMLLLIANVMFRAGNDPRTLNSSNGLGDLDAGQDWIRAKRR